MPLITEHDLQEAIAECQGQRNPNANTCIKLAAFLTLQKEMFGKDNNVLSKERFVDADKMSGYSFAQAPDEAIGLYGESDFLSAIDGKNTKSVFLIMDELMSTMQVLQPRIYDSVMRRINNI